MTDMPSPSDHSSPKNLQEDETFQPTVSNSDDEALDFWPVAAFDECDDDWPAEPFDALEINSGDFALLSEDDDLSDCCFCDLDDSTSAEAFWASAAFELVDTDASESAPPSAPGPREEPSDPAIFQWADSSEGLTLVGVDKRAKGAVVIPGAVDGKRVAAIGDGAFEDCVDITSVVLSDGNATIGDEAFKNCLALETIELPKRLFKLGAAAFSGCRSLKALDPPEGLTTIEPWTFEGCAALATIALPSSVTTIGDYAFWNCYSLAKATTSENLREIEAFAFQNCFALSEIELPRSVKSIARTAFDNCPAEFVVHRGSYAHRWTKGSARSVRFPKDDYFEWDEMFGRADLAFVDPSIEGVVALPREIDGVPVATIEDGAFRNCDKITSLVLPDGVDAIAASAFEGCSALESIIVSEENAHFRDVAGILFSKSGAELLRYPPGRRSKLFVALPTMKTIGEFAFVDCVGLKEIELPKNLTSIAAGAFDGCSALLRVHFNSCAQRLADELGLEYELICDDESVLKLANVPGGVSIVGADKNMEGDVVLNSTINGKRIVSIGNYAFRDCKKITSIELPDSLTSIGKWGFVFCTSLTRVKLSRNLSSIGMGAFRGCSNLEMIEAAPDSAYFKTESGVLYSKSGNALLVYPSARAKDQFAVPDGVELIADYAFFEMRLKRVALSGSVKTIGEFAFSGSKNLTHLDLPENLEMIGNSAFSDCKNLESVNFSANLATIGDYSFSDCKKLKTINLPDSLKTIGDSAFSGCENLESVIFPANLAAIGDDVFSGCKNLKSVNLLACLSIVDNIEFEDCPVTLLVHRGSCAHRCALDNDLKFEIVEDRCFQWEEVPGGVAIVSYDEDSADKVVVPEELAGKRVVAIGKDVFKNHAEITSITLPVGLLSIDDSAFSGCENLESIDLPERLTTIGKSAFSNCENLKTVKLSERLTIIDDFAFSGCESLESIDLPASLTTIGSFAFSGCERLESVDLPEKLERLDCCAFGFCSSLASFKVSEKNAYFKSVDGVLYNKAGDVLLRYPSARRCNGALRGNHLPRRYFVVPEKVTKIADFAFDKASLFWIELSPNLKEIGASAFCGSELCEIELPESLISIESDAFEDCLAMLLVHRDSYAFHYAINNDLKFEVIEERDFEWEEVPGGVAITSYEARFDDNVIVPEKLGDKPVVAIGKGAFEDCDEITSIALPAGLLMVDSNAFSGCENLESVDLSASLTSIGSNVFSGCENLSSVDLPASLTSIDDSAFEDCPATLRVQRDSYAFRYAYEHCLTFEFTDEAFAHHFRKSKASDSLVLVKLSCEKNKRVYLPDALDGKRIGTIGRDAARDCAELTELRLPRVVDSIEERAFCGCRSLTKIEPPIRLTSIGAEAFRDCSSLKSVALSDGLRSLGARAFCDCAALESVEMPEGLETLGSRAFAGCANLRAITLPRSLETIANSALDDCSARLFVWRDSLAHRFAKARALKFDFAFDESLFQWADAPGGIALVGSDASLTGAVVLPSTVRFKRLVAIGPNAFAGRSQITSVEIPADVASIATNAFDGCLRLRSIEVAEANERFQTIDGVLYSKPEKELIADPAVVALNIQSESEIKADGSAIISDPFQWNVVSDGVSLAFVSPDLKGALVLPDKVDGRNVVAINDGAFGGCNKIRSIVLPDSIESIGVAAFQRCYSLRSIRLSQNLKTLDASAFSDCLELMELELPRSLQRIDADAFEKCPAVLRVYRDSPAHLFAIERSWRFQLIDEKEERAPIPESEIESTVANVAESPVDEVPIKTPTKDKPENAAVDSVPSVVPAPSTVDFSLSETDGLSLLDDDSAFGDDEDDEEAEASDDMIELSDSDDVFEDAVDPFGCVELLGGGTAEWSPFNWIEVSGGVALESTEGGIDGKVKLPETAHGERVVAIGDGAFANCDRMTSIILPDGLESIGSGAFKNCSSLKRIELPDGVRQIGDGAFDGCSATLYARWNSTTFWTAERLGIDFMSPDCPMKLADAGDGIAIVGVKAHPRGRIVVPARLNGKRVVAIGARAFANSATMTAFEAPIGLREIDSSALRGCAALESVKLPPGVGRVGAEAFRDCVKLSSVQLSEGLTSLGSRAFSGCSSLVEIELPTSLIEIAPDAFDACPATLRVWKDSVAFHFARENGLKFEVVRDLETDGGFFSKIRRIFKKS